MGTSKGYIAPTRPEWSSAKRAVTGMSGNSNSDSRGKAASRFGTAVKSDGFSSSTFPSAASGIIELMQSVREYGSKEALTRLGFEELINKSNEEIFNEIFLHYANDGAKIEDSLVLDSISLTFSNLKIEDLEMLATISEEMILKEMLVTFAELQFEQKFTESIGKRHSPSETKQIIDEMKAYLRGTLYENLSLNDLNKINFMELSGEQYIIQACNDAFSVFEKVYEE